MRLPILFSSILLIAKVYDVSAQCRSRVEFLSPPAQLSTTSYVQPTGQFVIPAITQSPVPEPTSFPYPDFNYYNNALLPPVPPCYIAESDDDTWRQVLYVLILALKNKFENDGGSYGNQGGYGGCGCGGSCGCGGYCSGGCGCGCGGNGGNFGCGGDFGWSGNCGGNCCGNCGGNCGCNGGSNGGSNCGGNGGSNYGSNGGSNCGGNCCGNCGISCGASCNSGSNYFNYGGFGGNGCDAFNFNSGNGVTYIPYPIVVPMNCAMPGFGIDPCWSQDDNSYTCPMQGYGGDGPNDINILVRRD